MEVRVQMGIMEHQRTVSNKVYCSTTVSTQVGDDRVIWETRYFRQPELENEGELVKN